MKQKQTFHRPALGLLMAAAALPFTPAFAQDTAPTEPVVVDVTPPPVATPAPEETTPVYDSTTPIVTTPAPTVTAPVRTQAPTLSEPAATRQTSRTTQRSVTRARAPAPARTAAPVRTAAPAEPAPATAAGPAPLAATPPDAQPPAAAPAEAFPVETLPVAEAPAATSTGRAIWPWLALGAVLLIGALALLSRRRRRAVESVYEETAYAEPVRVEPAFEEPLAPAMAAPAFAMDESIDNVPVTEEVSVREDHGWSDPALAGAAAVGAGSALESGEPRLEFEMRPVRAGVGEHDARVDFELAVANTGTATARDVRISAWMLGAGAPRGSEAEHSLIEQVDIGVGDDANVEASVALPRSEFSEDAILPVVVAEARYRLPDGSEGRTTASYAVGVPDGDEMAHFDVENPSGLHEDVEARALGDLERA
jgi:LPXTG-motif cell wall-anchored protein